MTIKRSISIINRQYKSGCSAGGSAPDWGSGGRKFKSCHSDQNKGSSRFNELPLFLLNSIFARALRFDDFLKILLITLKVLATANFQWFFFVLFIALNKLVLIFQQHQNCKRSLCFQLFHIAEVIFDNFSALAEKNCLYARQ